MKQEVVMYQTSLCGFCAAAKRLLDNKGVEYRSIPVDTDPQMKQEMMDKSGQRTVPQIFIGDHHVGGFDDLNALESKGELDALLAG